MCHYCGHGCGRSSAVPISANGVLRVAPWIAQGNGIVVHIFLQIAVARLSKPRFAPFSFRAFHVCHDDDSSAHRPFPSACVMDYTIGVRASIRFQYKDT